MSTQAFSVTCCPFTLAEGCTNANSRWVSIRNPNGTITLIDPTDGSTVLPANALDFCPAGQGLSHITTVAASSVFVIPNTADLLSWSVRARGSGATLDINGGGANALDDNEVIEASAQDDDYLNDVVTITTDASTTVRVLWTERV